MRKKKSRKVNFIMIILLSFIFLGCTKQVSNIQKEEKLFDNKKFKKKVSKRDKDIFLKVDSGIDISQINDIIIDESNIVIASNDKHVRVINSNTGKTERKFLGDISFGEEGRILSIALSENKKYLAVAGTLGNREYQEKTIIEDGIPFSKKYLIKGKENIRIYNYKTGKLLRVIKDAHKDSIYALKFSENNRYLVSKSIDKKFKIWSVDKNFSFWSEISHEIDNLPFFDIKKNIGIQNNENTANLVFAKKNSIHIYDLKSKKIIENFYIKDLQLLKIIDDLIIATTFSREKRKSEIIVFNRDLKKLKTINRSFKLNTYEAFNDVIVSKDKKFLIVNNVKSIFPKGMNKESFKYSYFKNSLEFFDIERSFSKVLKKKEFQKDRVLTSMFLLENKILVLDKNNTLEIIDIKDMKTKYKFEQNIEKISHLKIDNNYNIYLSTKNNDSRFFYEKKGFESFKYDKIINLNNFKPQELTNSKDSYNEFSYYNTSNKLTLKMEEGHNWLALYDSKGNDIAVFDDTGLSSGINSFGWYKDMVFYNVQSDILIRRTDGLLLATLSGHTDLVTSIIQKDNIIISSSLDGTIRIWDLEELDENPKDLKLDPILFNVYYKMLEKERPNGKKSFLERETFLFAKKNNINLYYPIKQFILPILNILITKDNKYIAWTKEGFFDASKGIGEYIGYHINQGPNKESEFVTIENMYSTFYRPDLIKKVLKGESLDSYAKNINIKKLLKSGFAPEVKILTKSQNTIDSSIKILAQVCPKGNGEYDNLSFMINETPISVLGKTRALKIKTKSKRKKCFNIEENISLVNGKNNIGFKVTNKMGDIESNISTIIVNFDNTKLRNELKTKLVGDANLQGLNDLHILAVAINEYNDKELKLKLAVNDGTQMLRTIQAVSEPLFKNIHVHKLFDDKATKQNILKAFKGIKSKRNDVFLLYLAGHGITDEYNGNYYFLPVNFLNDGKKNTLKSQGVGEKDLMLSLSNVSALKSLILLDTCQSGGFINSNMQKTTTNKLSRSIGRAILSATSSSELAIEGYKGHGVFTFTLMEALKGKGYYGDERITVNELTNYTEEILPKRSWKTFKHRQTPQRSLYGVDFNIGEF